MISDLVWVFSILVLGIGFVELLPKEPFLFTWLVVGVALINFVANRRS